MTEIKDRQKCVLFGPFEADLHSQEIKKRGVRLRLSGQPFQILKMLLERPGELVTREQLRQTLWPSDTFVDFDHGLNAAVNKLRETLGDDAEAPRYIETLPKRGYRFIGAISPPPPAPAQASFPVSEQQQPAAKASRWPWPAVFVTIALCSAILAGFFLLRSPLPPPRIVNYHQLTTDRKAKNRPCAGASSARVVTDGTRVFFPEDGYGLRQVSANGGEVAPVSNPFTCFEAFDISPDKTELLGAVVTDPTVGDHPLWALSIVSGLARRIGSVNAHTAAWSPDGQQIAFVTGSITAAPNDVYIAAKDGREAREIARIDKGVVASVLWSSNGKVLRLGVGTAPDSIWEVSTDGTDLRLMHRLPGAECCFMGLSETSDEKYLIAQSGQALWAFRKPWSIFRRGSGDAIQLTSGPVTYQNPVLSPEGKKVFAIGGRARGELLRYNLKSQKLEPFLSGISAEQVDFSRDGKWVAYVTFPEGILWRSRVDGSERMQLTAPPLYAVLPRWSPDGTRIAFSAVVPGSSAKICLVPADGGNPELISQSSAPEVDATWTPDGNSLVFGGSMFENHTQVSIVELRTRQVSKLPGSEGMDSPRASPNGRFIYTEMASRHKSFLFDRQTQKWSELKEKLSGVGWAQWSSDSKYVYMESGPELPAGSYLVYRWRVADGKLEPTAKFDLPEGLVGVWGGWMSAAPDGTPLVLRDLSIQEIYALDVELP